MSIDFRIRDFCYPASIIKLKREFDRNQWLSPSELEAYQLTKLRCILEHAFSAVPFYRRMFEETGLRPSDIQSAGDLRKLPLLTKAVLQRPDDFIASDAAKYRPKLYRTSGTFGHPLSIFLDKSANVLEFVYYWRYWGWAGYKLGDRFAEIGSEFFLKRPQLSTRSFHWQAHLRRLMINSHRIGHSNAQGVANALRRHQPRFLHGTASSLFYLALTFDDARIDDISLAAIFSTGEVLLPHQRALIQKVFHGPVMDSYGHMERTVAVSQCPQGGYHVNSDYGLLELCDIREPEMGFPAARAVGTSLHNFAMPLIRYDTGDDILLFSSPQTCPCGRGFPLVRAIRGRSQDTIVTPDGRFVTSLFIVPEFVAGIIDFQFVQDSPDHLLIRVLPDAGFDDSQKQELLALTCDVMGPAVRIELECVSDAADLRDRNGKKRPIISLVEAKTDPEPVAVGS